MEKLNIVGSWPALVTPFNDNNEVDYDILRNLIDFQVENGSNGILLLGSTSEATLLSQSERIKIIDESLAASKNRVSALVGVSASTTKLTIENARYAKDAGADGGLIVQPGYIKPSQEAIYGYFKDVAEAARWYAMAAKQGRVAAQNNLGRLFQLGVGVEKNMDKAIFWYEQAAVQGSEAARENLSELLPGRF